MYIHVHTHFCNTMFTYYTCESIKVTIEDSSFTQFDIRTHNIPYKDMGQSSAKSEEKDEIEENEEQERSQEQDYAKKAIKKGGKKLKEGVEKKLKTDSKKAGNIGSKSKGVGNKFKKPKK